MIMSERSEIDVIKGFLFRIRSETYSETDSELHCSLIDRMLPQFANFLPDKQTQILDVGCGWRVGRF